MKLKKGRILPNKEEKIGELIVKIDKKRLNTDSKRILDYNRNYFNNYSKALCDKTYLTLCVKEVELFLIQNGYKKEFSLRSISHYKNKEFFEIFF